MPEQKKKRTYRKRKKKPLGAAGLDGYAEGIAFAATNAVEKDGTEYLAGFLGGLTFGIANAPTQKRRAKYGSKKKSAKKKPGPKPKAKKKP